jgi:hypothetical protein
MCYFCNGYWPINELTGLHPNTWMSGVDLDDIRFMCLDIYENRPVTDYYNSAIHKWMVARNRDYKNIILHYVSVVDEEYDFDRCRAHKKFIMDEQPQLKEEASHKALTTVKLWKPLNVRI